MFRLATWKWLVMIAFLGILSIPDLGSAQIFRGQTQIRVSPTNLDFGDVQADSSATLSVEIENASSNQDNEELTIQIDSPTSPFSVTQRGTSTLAPDETSTIQVSFNPNEGGIFASVLVITAKNRQGRLVDTEIVDLRGRAIEAKLRLPSNRNIDFGAIEAVALITGTTGFGSRGGVRGFNRQQQERSLTLVNEGTGDLIVNMTLDSETFELSGTGVNRGFGGVGGFNRGTTQDRTTATFTINPNSSQTVQIRIRQNLEQVPDSGRISDQLTIESNDRRTRSQTLRVIADILVPRYTGVTDVDFGETRVRDQLDITEEVRNSGTGIGLFEFRSSCTEVSVTVNATGTGTGTRTGFGGRFFGRGGGASIELEAGEVAFVTFSINPRDPGKLQCDVSVRTDDPDNPVQVITVTAEVTGTSQNRGFNPRAASSFEVTDPAETVLIQHTLSAQGVRFAVPSAQAAALRVRVFDLQGAPHFDSDVVSNHSLVWNLLDASGQRVANGVYLYVVTVLDEQGRVLKTQTEKLAILN